ncbi:fibronectin type III domain-containing protein [Patescibacteria group bacterium]|nr:fibronectin type III domain-containing protein [Patescibacteria group bacterium]
MSFRLIRSLLSYLFFIILILSFKFVQPVYATGTVSGTITGPHGETAAVSYAFTNGGTTINGTTGSDGTFNQSLSDGTWKLTFTPPNSFTYAQSFSIPTIPVSSGSSFNLGTLVFNFQVPTGSDSDLQQFATIPPACSTTGTPVIIRAYYEDQTKGSFLYQGRNANVIVDTDKSTYTVTVDYSILEGNSIGTNVVSAVSQGNGVYKATYVITNSHQGGGMPIISVTDGSSTTKTCLDPGPVNLDIRSFFTGSATTDFTTVSDFRSITDFTMDEANIVKVVFTKAVDMLDPTVQRFMKSIANKMTDKNGFLSLDAKAVLELKNDGAQITFYNITLNNPTILVDGSSDTGGVTSAVVYDRTNHTLTFNAAHFTTFQAVEASSNSSASTAPGCSDVAPDHAPNLFQIDTTADTAKLYLTPVNNAVSYYFVSYGYSSGDERFGASFNQGPYDGALSFTVNDLSPKTTYYFKVRAGNGCASGDWSNVLSARTNSNSVGQSSSPSEPTTSSSSNEPVLTPTIAPQPTLTENTSAMSAPSPTPVSAPTNNQKQESLWQMILNFFKRIFIH